MKILRDLLDQLASFSILGLSGLILSLFALQLLLTQTYISLHVAEVARFIATPWTVFLLLGLLVLSLYLLKPALANTSSQRLFALCSLFYLLAGLYLIFQVDDKLRADAKHVFTAALEFNQDNYTSLTEVGAYLYRNPHQLGLVSLERLYALLSPSPRLIFGANLLWVLGSNYLLFTLSQKATSSRLVANYTILLTFAFFPQFFFILFAYGSTPGLFFCLLGLYLLQSFLENGKGLTLLFSSLSLALATSIRNNYQLFALSLLALLLLALLKEGKWKPLVASLLIIASLLSSNKLLTSYYEGVVGQEIKEGTPKIAYITMGLMDSPKQTSLGGWYNAYNTRILKKNHFDQEAAETMAKQDLKKILKGFVQNPLSAARFFYDKVKSTWTEPTFQSIWTGPQVERKQYTHTQLLQSIYQEGRAYAFLNQLGAAFLILLYGSVGFSLLNLAFSRTSFGFLELLPAVFFLAGFSFHFFWETKSQYVYPYILCLIPTMAQSLTQGFNRLERWKKRRSNQTNLP